MPYLVALYEHSGLIGELLLDINVIADIAELLFHNSDRLEIGRSVEVVASECEELQGHERGQHP
jgi:hypothetical protein